MLVVDGPRVDVVAFDHRGDEFVPLAVHRANDPLRGPVVAHGTARGLDARRQRRLADVAVAPDGVEEFLLRHQLAAMLDQALQEIEHLRLDGDHVTAATQHDPTRIEFAIVELVDQDAPRSAETCHTSTARL